MGFIYKISSDIDDRVYIGSTIRLDRRWNEHRRDLSNDNHQNIHLQRFVNKYGLNCLMFDIIEEVDDNCVLIREQFYLDNTDNKFNIAIDSSAPMTGKHHTKESLEKIAIRSRGSNNPMFGKKRPQWLIDKLTLNSTGRIKNNSEKIKHLIVLPNRIEVIIKKDDIEINCFSITHASKIIGVSHQAICKALNKNSKSKGWTVERSNDNFYDKNILLQNIHLFDKNCHPQPELIEMLKTLSSLT